ncbi:MAG: ribonuclease III [Alphaproteobacteria bacterium]|nr:ribonuclease III [Alphaproteobacteria bacterium]
MARLAPDLRTLEERIGHLFFNGKLLAAALTHVSAAGPNRESYQRLEFLGDRVLGLVVAEMLYKAFPQADEGELSRRLAALVRKESCAEAAQAWGLEAYVRLGDIEKQSSAVNPTILGDVCESIIGAVFLDGGYEAAKSVITMAFKDRMHQPAYPLRDPKTLLQEWAQSRGLPAPLYRETARSGPDHAPEFTIRVEVSGYPQAEAKGLAKRLAEQAAAAAFIAREGITQKGAP